MLARELGKTVAELSSTISAHELAEWNQYLMLKEEDLKPAGLEVDLMNIFGGPRG